MFTKGNFNLFKGFTTFVQNFLLLKHGGWILFVISLIVGFIYNNSEIEEARFKGKKEGEANAADQILNLRTANKNKSEEINELKKNVYFYKKSLDTCETTRYSDKTDQYKKLNQEIDKAYEIAKSTQKKLEN